MPSFAPKIRVEVYVPIRYEPAYQDTLTWLIEEFTELRGGCTVNENVGGYYLSQNSEVIDDRVSGSRARPFARNDCPSSSESR